MALSKTLLGLALLCFMVMVAQCEPENFGRQMLSTKQCRATARYDYFGGDIRRVDHVFSWQHCCNLCKRERGCKGYTWRSEFKHCWLKHTLANYQYCANCWTEAVRKPPPVCRATARYDYFGGDIRRVDHVFSWQRCCFLCKRERGCKGYTWRSEFKHCWLKHTLANYQYCANCWTQSFH